MSDQMIEKPQLTPFKIYRCLVDACDGLVYVSETDSPVKAFRADAVPAPTTATDFAKFMQHQIELNPDWFPVVALMRENLMDRVVWRVGDGPRVAYYAFGVAGDGKYYGVTFEAVET